MCATASVPTSPAGRFQRVDSDVIYSVKYDEPGQVLTVVLVGGDVFDYQGVPKEVYEGLLAAKSKGAFFNENIKPKFEGKKFSL